MTDIDELRRLATLAAQGDQEALVLAVELAGRIILLQELANAPAGIRDEALAAHATLWKARKAKANRSKATVASNKARGEANAATVADALELVSEHDKPASQRVTTVRGYLIRNDKRLCKNTIRKHMGADEK